MGELALRESEGCPQISLDNLAISVLLDGFQNLGINSDLVGLPLLRGFVSLLLSIEDVSLLLGCLLSLPPGEIFVVRHSQGQQLQQDQSWLTLETIHADQKT